MKIVIKLDLNKCVFADVFPLWFRKINNPITIFTNKIHI